MTGYCFLSGNPKCGTVHPALLFLQDKLGCAQFVKLEWISAVSCAQWKEIATFIWLFFPPGDGLPGMKETWRPSARVLGTRPCWVVGPVLTITAVWGKMFICLITKQRNLLFSSTFMCTVNSQVVQKSKFLDH